jgi:ATP synthase assembly factor FMC1, mitochondrial
MAEARAHWRSLYRSILRELRPRPFDSPPTPLQTSIRAQLSSPVMSSSPTSSPAYFLARRQEAEQAVRYLKAQRMYGALLERYNPGLWMDEEERTRLTARRVGMEMPIEFVKRE